MALFSNYFNQNDSCNRTKYTRNSSSQIPFERNGIIHILKYQNYRLFETFQNIPSTCALKKLQITTIIYFPLCSHDVRCSGTLNRLRKLLVFCMTFNKPVNFHMLLLISSKDVFIIWKLHILIIYQTIFCI